LVFLEPVTIAIAVTVNPLETLFCRLEMPLQEAVVARRLPGSVEQDQIERRGIGGSVIRCVRHGLEVRQLAKAQLVHDLAGFGVAAVVAFGSLVDCLR
jgi:hypothetical protein